MHALKTIIAALLLPVTPVLAQNPHVVASDLRPRDDAGKVQIDAFDDSSGTLVQGVRTFGWQFQTIPGDPYFIQDPGFNATSASGLPGGSALGFSVTTRLRCFGGGSAAVGFGNTPTGESISLTFGAGIVTVTDASGPQPGFNFVTLASNGSAHRHLNSILNNGNGAIPSTGVYMTSIRVSNTGGLTPSDALFLVFNNGAAPADFDRAIRYVATPFAGDADFSGRVDIDDFGLLAANFNRSSANFWYDGDFNNDRRVDIDDFGLLAANFNQTAPASLQNRGATVPEPAFMSVALFAACVARRRRRRSF